MRRVTLTFGLVSTPEHLQWPMHGRFAVFMNGAHAMNSPPVFSIEGLRVLLEGTLEIMKDVPPNTTGFGADEAMKIEERARALGLPSKMTRFDHLIGYYSEDLAFGLIDRLTGNVPNDPGSGPTTFERCTEGHLCESPNCKRYRAHGCLTVEGMVHEYLGEPSFSTVQALRDLEDGIRTGAFDPTDRARISASINAAGLIEGEEPTRMDLATKAKTPFTTRVLDVLHEIATPRRDAHFIVQGTGSDRHVKLFAWSNVPVKLGRLCTLYQVLQAFESGRAQGLLDDEAITRLRTELDTLNLPIGGPADPLNRQVEQNEAMLVQLAKALSSRGTTLHVISVPRHVLRT